jgi:hypothetical protein
VVAIDGEELEGRDADTVTSETFTSRDNIDTDDGAEEDLLLENVCDRNVELESELVGGTWALVGRRGFRPSNVRTVSERPFCAF